MGVNRRSPLQVSHQRIDIQVLAGNLLQVDQRDFNAGRSLNLVSELVLKKLHGPMAFNQRAEALPILGERISNGLCVDDGHQLSVVEDIPSVKHMSTSLLEWRVHDQI